MKTKLGISVGLFAALMCVVSYSAGYVGLLLMVGYVLICEENEWLRKMTIKILLLAVMFTILYVVVAFIPNVFNILDDFLSIFAVYISLGNFSNIFSFFSDILDVLKILIYVFVGFCCLKEKEIKLGILDKIIEKYVG